MAKEARKEVFYTYDSYADQILRVVKVESPKKLDIYTSDASTDGSQHDHNYLDKRTGTYGFVPRSQQKKG